MMPIEEKNSKCIEFARICEEVKERYRKQLDGWAVPPINGRDVYLDEAMRTIMLLMDLDEFFLEGIDA